MPRRFVLLGAFLVVLGVSPACAHVALTESEPAQGDKVPSTGFSVELRFSGRLDVPRSRLVLVPADGQPRKLAAKVGVAPNTIAAQVDPVPPGPCELRYDILAADGHMVSGALKFTATGP